MTAEDDLNAAIEERIQARRADTAWRRSQRRRRLTELAERRRYGLQQRHTRKLNRLTKGQPHMADGTTYNEAVRSFDHAALAQHPGYAPLRLALSDFANQVDKAGGMKLQDFLDAVRDMAVTSPYGDSCATCAMQCAREHQDPEREGLCPCGASTPRFPYAVERRGDRIRGAFACPQGHTWVSGFSIDYATYL